MSRALMRGMAAAIAGVAIVSGSLPTLAQSAPTLLDYAAAAFTAGLAANEALLHATGRADRRTAQSELSKSIWTLTRIGARPANNEGDDILAEWQASLPPSTATPLRGRGLGPGYHRARLGPAQIYRQQQVFLGGELARVVVAPGPHSSLVLEVSDRNGAPVCRTRVQTNPGGCSWTPIFTSRHTLAVTGEKEVASHFVILTN